MTPYTKYLPHLGLTALIVFLASDYFSSSHDIVLSNSGNLQAKKEGSHKEGSKTEGSHLNGEGTPGDNLSQEERERRMGIFHYNEGNKLFAAKNYSEAVTNYEKALHHNKAFKEAIINLSTAYMKIQMFDKALKILQTGQTQFPKAALIDYNLACYYSLTENLKMGLINLQQAVGKGYKQFEQMESDPDLDNLRNWGEYKTWKKQMYSVAKT